MQHIPKDVFFFAKNNAPDNQVVRRNLKIVFGIVNKKPYISFVRLREMKNLNTKNMKNTKNPLFEMNNDILFDLVIDIKYKELNPITKELLLSNYNTLGNFTENMIEEMFNLKPLLTGVNDIEIVKNFLNTNLK